MSVSQLEKNSLLLVRLGLHKSIYETTIRADIDPGTSQFEDERGEREGREEERRAHPRWLSRALKEVSSPSGAMSTWREKMKAARGASLGMKNEGNKLSFWLVELARKEEGRSRARARFDFF